MNARPPDLSDDAYVRGMATYFSSYFLASFALQRRPDVITVPRWGCGCDLCACMAPASRFRPRRVGTRAKRAATDASLTALHEAAAAQGLSVSAEDARALLADPLIRSAASMVAYTVDLLERIRGRSGDEMSLALWRRFAYDGRGAPIQGFELTADLVERSATVLATAVRAHASTVPD